MLPLNNYKTVIVALLIGVTVFVLNNVSTEAGDKPMNMKSSASQVTNNTNALRVEYEWKSGATLGVGLQERQRMLVIDEKSSSVTYEQHRSESDAPGEAIGIYKMPLPATLISEVMAVIHSLKPAELRPTTGGGPGVSLMTLRVQDKSTHFEKNITSQDLELLSKLEPLIDKFQGIQGDVLQHPVSVLKASVQMIEESSHIVFELRLENIGNAPLVLANPLQITHQTSDLQAIVQIAYFPEERPGFTAPPLEWKALHLVPAKGAATADIVLNPKQVWSARTESWTPAQHNARHLAQGVYSNYNGNAHEKDIYRIRGAVFSDALEFTAK